MDFLDVRTQIVNLLQQKYSHIVFPLRSTIFGRERVVNLIAFRYAFFQIRRFLLQRFFQLAFSELRNANNVSLQMPSLSTKPRSPFSVYTRTRYYCTRIKRFQRSLYSRRVLRGRTLKVYIRRASYKVNSTFQRDGGSFMISQ